MSEERTLTDMVCLGCGCLCDDVRLSISQNRVAGVEPACPSGEQWFTQPVVPAAEACRIQGEPATLAEATRVAAEKLTSANCLAVTGLAGVSTDAQRSAIAIADLLGGAIVGNGMASARALATHGSISATLGEVAQRADVVIFWRCDPATTHPRHFERYSLAPTSEWLPGGRSDRTVFSLGAADTPTAAEADQHLNLTPGADYEALAALRALGRGLPVDASAIQADTGVTLATWQALAKAAAGAKYVAVFYNSQLSADGHASLGAMTRWMADLQENTRASAISLGAGIHKANASGASNVVAWQSGFTGDVDFTRGYPRPLQHGPMKHDAALILAAEALSEEQLGGLGTLPRIVLAATEQGAQTPADVLFRVAPPGFAARSSVHRSDGVALPLRNPWATDALSAELVLRLILNELNQNALNEQANANSTEPTAC